MVRIEWDKIYIWIKDSQWVEICNWDIIQLKDEEFYYKVEYKHGAFKLMSIDKSTCWIFAWKQNIFNNVYYFDNFKINADNMMMELKIVNID